MPAALVFACFDIKVDYSPGGEHSADNLSIFWRYLNDKGAFKPECSGSETRDVHADHPQGDRGEVDKFTEQDLSALKSKDDLVTKVIAKYGLDKTQAQRDVDALLKGRHI